MVDFPSVVGVTANVALVGLCIKLARENGKNTVSPKDCNDAMQAHHTRIDDLQKHIDTRIDDVCGKINIIKDFILKK